MTRRGWICAISAAAIAGATLTPEPLAAQVVVYDPRANVQALLSAARQVESLAHQARALSNQARSLAASPYSHLAASSETLRDIGELARTVRGAASTVEGVQREFRDLYPDDLSMAELDRLGADRSDHARRTAEDLARTAAALERLSGGREGRVRGALTASAAAQGETAAIQSSTQMLSVLAEELASLRALLLAQSRLMAETTAREAAEGQSALEARRRFWGRATTDPVAPTFNPLSRARN